MPDQIAPETALIGFGEAASTFARAGAWGNRARAYDLRAERSNTASAAEALAGAPLVISLVTADQALPAAQAYAAHLAPGALWCDGNSVAPQTKRAAAAAIESAGGRYVDMAILAPVDPAALRVPLLLAGQHAAEAETRLRALGFTNIRIVGAEVGRASAIKMIRSVMVKGIEALTDEMMQAAEAAGVAEDVLASLDASEKPQPWAIRSAYNRERMATHGLRRAAEMEESAATLSALGIEPVMTRGTVQRQRAAAQSNSHSPPPPVRIIPTSVHVERSRDTAHRAWCLDFARHERGRERSTPAMIIDCHGHYTVLPKAHDAWREAQKAAFKAGEPAPAYPDITDAEIRETIEANQLRLIKERGADMTIFSPRASAMAPHVGDQSVAVPWARACNDLIARVVGLFPETFAGVCMLPQSPEADLTSSIAELERCVTQLGFIGCNLNPDPGGGHFTHPPLTDPYWFPLYEKMVELDVPAMIHVSGSCNPAQHATGAYYIAADTIAFMQLLEGDLFSKFPTLRFIIPHGGGAVPYHWGRYRGLADMLKKPDLSGHLMNNVFFDTCVYHQPGVNLLAEVIETKNILFGSEMVGAVRGIDPTTGQYFDDTKRYVDALPITDEARHAIFEGNARRVYPRLDAKLKEMGK